MSMISEELRKQQEADVGAAIRKVFGDVPCIDRTRELTRFVDERTRLLSERCSVNAPVPRETLEGAP